MLLASDGAIWLTNVITFVLSYLNPDRRGPTARANGGGDPGALIFPEMKNEEHVAPRWTLKFIEYDHFATALSSTDVSANRPLTKLMMMAEEAISLVIALLVTTRAVDIPRWAGGRERDAPMAEEFRAGSALRSRSARDRGCPCRSSNATSTASTAPLDLPGTGTSPPPRPKWSHSPVARPVVQIYTVTWSFLWALEWALEDSNLRPQPCEGCALTN
jgi:hypothetical protein